MPGFQRVYEDYKDQGFTVLGISRDQGSPDLVRAFLREKKITYPVAMASQANLGEMSSVTTLPTSFLLGRDGRIGGQEDRPAAIFGALVDVMKVPGGSRDDDKAVGGQLGLGVVGVEVVVYPIGDRDTVEAGWRCRPVRSSTPPPCRCSGRRSVGP